MASKAASLEKQVECPICLEQYKEPKVLSCLHSYCKSCLQKYVKKTHKQHKITCPKCRQETEVRNGDVDKLQANFWVNNLIGFLTISCSDKAQKVICENCDSGDAAVSWCSDCSVFICDLCVKAHSRMRNLKHHQIVSIEEVKAGSPKALIKPMHCKKHGEEILKLFCQSCDETICRDCALVDHQGHKYVFAADAAHKEKEDVRDLLEKTKVKAPDLANGVKSVEAMEKRVQAKLALVNQDIDALRVKQIKALDGVIASLKHEANTISQAKMKQLQAQREGLMIALASINNSVEFTERALEDGSDVEVLSMKKQLVTNLSKLSSSTWECEPCQEDTFQLTVHQDIVQVADNIATVEDFYIVPEKCTVMKKGGRATCLTVFVMDNHGKKRSNEKVHVSIVGPNTQEGPETSVKVTDQNDGSYDFTLLTPQQLGRFWCNVRVTGQHIRGSPFCWIR